MFNDTTDLLQTMELIDSIQLLGLDYHFQKEISKVLSRIHDAGIDDRNTTLLSGFSCSDNTDIICPQVICLIL
ncbi:hypothetical protein MUK42_12683 [Musa troglodytarum]|nr:hypothetical protein MUK42_12683 [Musa troglodytarum]